MQAIKQLVVFHGKGSIARLQKEGAYRHRPMGYIPAENVLSIELPDDYTGPHIPPIRLNREKYNAIEHEAIVLCLDRAIALAHKQNYTIEIKCWAGPIDRNYGVARLISLKDTYLPHFSQPDKPAEELLSKLGDLYSWGGCAEIVAVAPDDEICFYHQENADTYLTPDLFDFLEEG